jgi:putative glutamine amidotransferase
MDKPLVGIVMNERMVEDAPTYTLATKYVKPVVEFVNGIPILLPPAAHHPSINEWLKLLDGLLLTGSHSDIHPERYGETIKNPDSFFDVNRDETSLNLIRGAIAIGLPVLGICRGFQEINVALGGTLHQSVHRTPNFLDHREVVHEDKDVSYAHRHKVTAIPEGKLSKIVNKSEWQVNSLHDQGVHRLSDKLQAEAYAPDGLIEAFSLKNKEQFLLATQWHIEWKPHLDECSANILRAFGHACASYRANKNNQSKG